MASMIRKSLDSPEETRPVKDGMGQVELVNLDAGAVGRATFLPGWKWSQHVKPIARTDSCMFAHKGYTISGRLKVVMDDGEENELARVTSASSRRGTTPGLSVMNHMSSSTGRAWTTTPNPRSEAGGQVPGQDRPNVPGNAKGPGPRFRDPGPFLWWRHGDSNPEPPACKAGALPIAPCPHKKQPDNHTLVPESCFPAPDPGIRASQPYRLTRSRPFSGLRIPALSCRAGRLRS